MDQRELIMDGIRFLPHAEADPALYTVVIVDLGLLDHAWRNDQSAVLRYVASNEQLRYLADQVLDPIARSGALKSLLKKSHYERKLEEPNPVIIMPLLSTGGLTDDMQLFANGVVDFADGRHRTAALIEKGYRRMPVHVYSTLAQSIIDRCGEREHYQDALTATAKAGESLAAVSQANAVSKAKE
ncbi:MAG: hypothetical protein EB060_02205 [Proteobacteria bacterium]|nr:hypothetical protein [Pseudomonadota bacterium]